MERKTHYERVTDDCLRDVETDFEEEGEAGSVEEEGYRAWVIPISDESVERSYDGSYDMLRVI